MIELARLGTEWTDNEVAQLKQFIADGLSASKIAGRTGRTKNAVIGKLDRLRMKKRERFCRRSTSEVKPQRVAPFRAPTPLIELPPKQSSDIVRCGIFDLTSKTCHWPIGNPGEPGFGFCGDIVLSLGSYCHMHALRASNHVGRG